MKLGLVVTDGVGVRNFVHGRFLPTLAAAGDAVDLYSGVPLVALRDLAGAGLTGVRLREMPIYYEPAAARFCRKALELAHLHHFATVAMRYNLAAGRPHGWRRGALFNRAAGIAGAAGRSAAGIRLLGRLHEAAVDRHPLVAHYQAQLTAARPHVLFFTHQRPPQLFPLARAARRLGILTAAFLFSWDNLSSKGRMPVGFDHYLVWSRLMRDEMRRFYPDVAPERVQVVGTPQFEPYAYDEWSLSPAQFAATTGLDPARRRILFSAGDASTSPNDPLYVQTLAQAVRDGAFGAPLEIVVRQSPAEGETRFAALRAAFPEVVWCPPRWVQTRVDHPEPWSQRVPEAGDLCLLKALTHYSALNVNMASTMTLDFAFADKPVVNVAFSPPGAHDDAQYYRFDHYQPVVALGSVQVAHTPAELIAAVRGYLADPTRDAAGRQALLALQVGLPLAGTSERIRAALHALVGVGAWA